MRLLIGLQAAPVLGGADARLFLGRGLRGQKTHRSQPKKQPNQKVCATALYHPQSMQHCRALALVTQLSKLSPYVLALHAAKQPSCSCYAAKQQLDVQGLLKSELATQTHYSSMCPRDAVYEKPHQHPLAIPNQFHDCSNMGPVVSAAQAKHPDSAATSQCSNTPWDPLFRFQRAWVQSWLCYHICFLREKTAGRSDKQNASHARATAVPSATGHCVFWMKIAFSAE
jgi:hypothetical protein